MTEMLQQKKTDSLLFQFNNKENICGINPIRWTNAKTTRPAHNSVTKMY